MPIISVIGRRSWKVRLAIGIVYTLLIVGAISMLYPLLLMLSGSTRSETDFIWVTPIPEYLYDDTVLWMKYIESKYSVLPEAEASLHEYLGSWRNTKVPPPAAVNSQTVRLFREFRQNVPWPKEWYTLGHSMSERPTPKGIPGKNTRLFKEEARKRFHGDIEAFSDAVGVHYPSFAYVGPPRVPFAARRFTYPQNDGYKLYYQLKASVPRADWVVVNVDGEFWRNYLLPVWHNVADYNTAHDTHYSSYDQVLLATTPPANPKERADWEDFVRNQLGLAFIRVNESMTAPFRAFLKTRYRDAAELNHGWGSSFSSIDQIPLPEGVPVNPRAQVDFAAFIKNAHACPLNALSISGPRQAFEAYVAQQRRRVPSYVPADLTAPIPLPIAAVDWVDFSGQKPSLKWEFIKRNYLTVWDYIGAHGNGISNTIIYCSMMILASLIVNPLAAYALSRYRPPSTYTILLLCMCTMAFPAEVTMIPSFLLLKKLSLLNTFWALVLPAMANGFSIFLLKGFFDSLPRELYEAADLDGAGEWTKFWLITMTLSKPILAIIALDAFTSAYTQFMMALVIIPDPKMWTLMVWLFQMQTWSHPSVVYASLVIAAVPTMLVFLLCQGFIMRGIVVPTEK
jgi:multiple sugar transport system permease protein